jgi:hypothetical protein
MIAVVDGSGDLASISLYVGENGTIRKIRGNGSIFDSLGIFYSVISSCHYHSGSFSSCACGMRLICLLIGHQPYDNLAMLRRRSPQGTSFSRPLVSA